MSMSATNKILTLMRHGESDQRFRGRDFDRPLSPNGIAFCQTQSPLIDALPPINFVLCSGSLRTKQTLDVIKTVSSFPDAISYDDALFLASTKYLVQAVEAFPEDANHAYVIGHGPTMSGMYQWLTDGSKTHHLLFGAGDIKSCSLAIESWQKLYPGCCLT